MPLQSIQNLKRRQILLFKNPQVKLSFLMAPEHGIRGDAHAQESVKTTKDLKTNLPVYSLFGETPKPTPQMLKNADIIVYDLQDVGVRSYTYITTLALVMEAAAEAGIPLIVLDRPNPLGGLRVEGNTPQPDFKQNFICWLRIPFVYGMTPGELAKMINGEQWLRNKKQVDLTVVPMKGWTRDMLFEQTGLHWVPTSPHIPHSKTALFYAASALSLPGLSNGVGYTLPFEIIGMPSIDPDQLATKLNKLGLSGLHFRPVTFKPFYSAFKEQLVDGVQIHISDPKAAELTPIVFYVSTILQEMHPERALLGTGENEAEWAGWEMAVGNPKLRQDLIHGKTIRSMLKEWRKDIDAFQKLRNKYLLY